MIQKLFASFDEDKDGYWTFADLSRFAAFQCAEVDLITFSEVLKGTLKEPLSYESLGRGLSEEQFKSFCSDAHLQQRVFGIDGMSLSDWLLADSKKRVWQVNDKAGDGLLVNEQEDQASYRLPVALGRGARVCEAVPPRGDRLCFEKLTGIGPEKGWVTLPARQCSDDGVLDQVSGTFGLPAECLLPAATLADTTSADYWKGVELTHAPKIWRVVGGTNSGGILVRGSKVRASQKEEQRLSCGALVLQMDIQGDRLQYGRLTGAGPAGGWVSLTSGGKSLLVRHHGPTPGVPQAWRAVDEAGLQVRKGPEESSPEESQRLASGAVVLELDREGLSLHYLLLRGCGPPVGWVSLTPMLVIDKTGCRWRVRPQAEKGGIVVYQDAGFSKEEFGRLLHDAVVQEVQITRDGLQYVRVSGTGPACGWVKTTGSGGDVFVRTSAGPSVFAAGDVSATVRETVRERDVNRAPKAKRRSKPSWRVMKAASPLLDTAIQENAAEDEDHLKSIFKQSGDSCKSFEEADSVSLMKETIEQPPPLGPPDSFEKEAERVAVRDAFASDAKVEKSHGAMPTSPAKLRAAAVDGMPRPSEEDDLESLIALARRLQQGYASLED